MTDAELSLKSQTSHVHHSALLPDTNFTLSMSETMTSHAGTTSQTEASRSSVLAARDARLNAGVAATGVTGAGATDTAAAGAAVGTACAAVGTAAAGAAATASAGAAASAATASVGLCCHYPGRCRCLCCKCSRVRRMSLEPDVSPTRAR